jgi:UPF0755 protein
MMAKSVYRSLLLVLFILELTVAGMASRAVERIWRPSEKPPAAFAIRQGESFRRVVFDILAGGDSAQAGALYAYGRLTEADRHVKSGRYQSEAGWSVVQALEQTTVGANDPLRVTIRPGLILSECAAAFERSGWVKSATEWTRSASEEATLMGLALPSFEGLLAPDTYHFDGPTEPDALVKYLRSRWEAFVGDIAGTTNLKENLGNGLTLHETIVLASIVEKEACRAIDMATASSVFHNRLKKNWPLGSAVTLRYALRSWKGFDEDLPVGLKSPFNTSRKPGLPPAPICIPSEQAIRAAIAPAKTPYFFFVADGDGGLIFNKTLDAHKNSVKGYRKKRDDRLQAAELAEQASAEANLAISPVR